MRVKEIVWENEITDDEESTNQNVLNEFIKKIEEKGYSVKEIKYAVTDSYSHALVVFGKRIKRFKFPTDPIGKGEPANVEEEVDEEWA